MSMVRYILSKLDGDIGYEFSFETHLEDSMKGQGRGVWCSSLFLKPVARFSHISYLEVRLTDRALHKITPQSQTVLFSILLLFMREKKNEEIIGKAISAMSYSDITLSWPDCHFNFSLY